MFKILKFLLIASIISILLVWILDNNGSIIIHWLGYEIRTDIMTAILLVIFFAVLIFISAYFLAKMLSIKLPKFNKILTKKND